MFGLFEKKLTENSNHFLDWSRIGELFGSGTHRYSLKELTARAFVIGCTATFSYLSASLNDEKKTGCSYLTMLIAGGVVGFVFSHLIVISPLILKRYNMSQECSQMVDEIRSLFNNAVLKNSENRKQLINDVIEHILKISLSDEKHARASETWGNRIKLLSRVKLSLVATDEDIIKFWGEKESVESILEKLSPTNIQRNTLKF